MSNDSNAPAARGCETEAETRAEAQAIVAEAKAIVEAPPTSPAAELLMQSRRKPSPQRKQRLRSEAGREAARRQED
jgi:hypothetical protein